MKFSGMAERVKQTRESKIENYLVQGVKKAGVMF